MLAESNPPITITPISSYLDEETVAQRAVALDGSKMKKVLGWSPAVQLNSEGVREIIQEYKDAGVWGESRDPVSLFCLFSRSFFPPLLLFSCFARHAAITERAN